ncbi:phenol hydroxylase subunit P4 [Alcaligenes parafaecalis]|uniref:Phenol hydroxylase n=1 Tax=Alcaligenes parafaecalis TaxID=171260 RepID=A0ABT3VLU4_9BURK|nr:phenol hydroxylase subunit P4 [Alcaligenes parafaecalis]MCX5463076.1 phenol hydroxylase [Alcaligenes parafaecalis]
MAVTAITPDYQGYARDQKSHYGESMLLYIGWDEHLLFCSAKAFLVQPDMTVSQLIQELMPAGFAQHPDFEQIEWSKVQWNLNGEAVELNPDATLGAKGFDHKSLLRFKTPGLNGYKGTGV